MQNKGAIKIFALLLTLACIFYLSFTWVTRGVESQASEYADGVVSGLKYKELAKQQAGGDAAKQQSILEEMKDRVADRYLDSMKKEVVYDLLVAEYTYEECK